MHKRPVLAANLVLFLALVFMAMANGASAQSSITGVVKDATGAVLPGVTVEAASPALIEKVRTVLTDETGQYRVIDLRAGIYVVTFTLPGFSTVRREGIELETNFTASVNIDMRVGALEETVTVSGATPVVDVQSSTRREVLSTAVIDALPTARNYGTIGATLPAVNSPGTYDVGGSSSMQQQYLRVYGGQTGDMMFQIDGMPVISADRNTGVYYNTGAMEEMVYQLAGGGAESSSPGITFNMIPKQGGNEVKGNALGQYSYSSLQGRNIDDSLRARGFLTPSELDKQWDVNVTAGGPIRRDRLWFLGSVRNWTYNAFAANAFFEDGSRGVDDNLLEAYTARLTFQLNSKNKVTALYDRMPKYRGHREIENGGIAPEATVIQTTPLSYIAQAKWTATLSNRVLVEAGWSENYYNYRLSYQPDVDPPSAAKPYGDISKVDLLNGTRTNAATQDFHSWFGKPTISTAVSFVTGAHAFKAGIQYGWGWSIRETKVNGDLIQNYRNGVPDSVSVRNTPNFLRNDLDLDLGIYVQDSWTINRLTVNPGVRFQKLRGSIPEQTSPAGRFVPSRRFDPIDNLPDWSAVSPRFGAAYDLFGNGRTAIKGSIGRYMEEEQTTITARYNPLVQSTDTRTWNDLNRNDIAEENELGPTTNRSFGIRRNINPDPNTDNFKWPSQVLASLGVQHELTQGMSLAVTYNRRDYHDMFFTNNLAVPLTAYTLVSVADPRGNGQTLPVYNLDRAFSGLVDERVTTSPNNTRTFDGMDVQIRGRMGPAGSFTAGTSTGRIRGVTCDVTEPNALRLCDERESDVPFRTTFKVSGNYVLPFGVRLGTVLQSTAGEERVIQYLVNRSIVPTLTLAQVSVRLNEPGSSFGDRVNQFDVSLGKELRRGRLRFVPQLEIFNLLNANPALSENNTFGPTLGDVRTVLEPRILRLNARIEF